MAENDIVALKELASGGFLEVALAPADISAAPAVPLIEVTIEDNFDLTLTTAQVPCVLVFLIDSDVVNPEVNLSLPESLTYEKAGAEVIIRLVREAGTTTGIDLSVSAGSGLFTGIFTESSTLTFRWDGVRWLRDNDTLDSNFRILGSADATKKLAFEVDTNVPTTSTVALTVPAASGTIALNETFAAPPAIGNTTPAAGTFTTLAANNGALTASAPVLDLAQTWNAGGTTFTGLQLNVTNAASASGSKLIALQVGNSDRLRVGLQGTGNAGTALDIIGGTGTGAPTLRFFNGATQLPYFYAASANLGLVLQGAAAGQITIGSNNNGNATSHFIVWQNATALGTEDGTDTLAQRRSTAAQTFRLYTTYASGTSFERLSLRGQTTNNFIIATEKGTTGGAARGLELRTDSVTRLTLGDAGGVTIADANDIAVGTTTGTKIGTATTQKIGFFNATPVVQQAAIADATDAATTQARLNDLLAAMRSLGLIAT